MRSSPRPASKRARASQTGTPAGEELPQAFDRLVTEEPTAGGESLAEVATLQRWANAGRMVASAAHEMRGALAAAQMNLEYMSAELGKPERQQTPAEISLAAEEARQGILRALSTTQAMLSLSLGGPGAIAPVSAAAAVERAISAVAPRLRGLPSIEVSCAGAPEVEADAGALHHALVSLLLNAAEAVGEGRPQGRVRVDITACAEAVRIAVSDTGHPKRGATAAGARVPPRRDAGLGLSLSRTLVHAFGGELAGGEGGPLGGCEFTLSLRPA